MRGRSLFLQVFASILAGSLAAVAIGGVIARALMSGAFAAYLETLPAPMGRGMGRGMVLGGAEQAFLSSVNNAMLLAALVSVVVAGVIAVLLARRLARPLQRLRAGAEAVAAGELTHRVRIEGPAEVRDLGGAFNEMASSLEEAETLRRRLVADVAHELRNPVAALKAQTEGIAEGVLTADAARIASLSEDVEHLSRLIDDLQELTAAEGGGLAYEMADVDLVALARREASRAEGLAVPGVEVVAEAPGAAVTVLGDERRLSQVVRNLVANAVRHTAQGTIALSVRASGDRALFSVDDTGEGIPDEALPYIFERFYRADEARTRHTGGSGIGLAVARAVIHDHGGEVFAANRPEGGASVGFDLPLKG